MKKILFSVWNDLTEPHPSVPEQKLEAFDKYKSQLVERHKQYAYQCNADYEIFSSDTGSYVDTQFFKISQCEHLCEEYDKAVYLDMDVIPKTDKNIFDEFQFGAYFLSVEPNQWLQSNIRKNKVDAMDMYSKLCCKNAMLLLDGINGNNLIANTGVLVYTKDASVNFSERFESIQSIFEEAKEDNLYPSEISSSWQINNEVFYSYIIEKNSISYDNIGLQWNFILDDIVTEYSAAAHMIHQVNKDFKVGLQ